MSTGSRVGCGREIGPRCRGPKSPVNVELLQALKDRWGSPAVLRLLRVQPSSANGNGKKLPKTGNIFPSSASCPPRRPTAQRRPLGIETIGA
jgi:hypothetical protein